ncbi:MAG TPA: substrate-binding domain-containing protein [Acidimicrobiales bacterium]|nr:substrate-binding domain-containing protein [Acidimicrobiales bacterium]
MSQRGLQSGRRAALAVPIAVGLVSIGSLFSLSAVPASATVREAQAGSFKVCMGTGGQTGLSWTTGQGQVLQSIAKKEGWQSVILSNNNSASTALANVRTFVLDKCNAIVEFNGQPSANPVMEKLTSAAHIPTITYDIGQPGWYFVGIDNLKAGIAGGQMLGTIVKQKWNCDADALIASEGPGAGIVNTYRTGGMVTGVLDICPNLKSKVFQYIGNGQISTALPPARALISAHPSWKKMVAVGLNDSGVVGTLEAAEQLGRAQDILGWGQDGSLITGNDVDPHLLGSVEYFLEGYPEWALPLLKDIAAGHPPAMADTASDPAVQIQPCPVTRAQAAKIPDYSALVAKLLTVSPGTTEQSLYCPTNVMPSQIVVH